MAEVELSQVTKIYPGDVRAVDHVSLTILDREFIVLVGPSGCGKSTTLRMIAGLEDITAGTIRIGERIVNSVAPKDRDIAMVFQNYALYPHMTVYKNMAFGLLLRRKYAAFNNPAGFVFAHGHWQKARAERQEIDRRVHEAAGILGIEELLHRRPKALSGGQRQRVAVGRAIVRHPKAFLFDEPLSNLDAKLRIGMRAELKRLHRQVQTTTVYVTHDQEEAMTLGDRVVVMKDGIIHQTGTPYEVYEHPANRFVAGFVGTPPMNFFEGRLVRDGDRLLFDEGDNRLAVSPAHRDALAAFAGQPITLGIRPEALSPAILQGGVGVSPAAAGGVGVSPGGVGVSPGGVGVSPGGVGVSPADAILNVQVSVVEPLGDRADIYCGTPKHPHIVSRVDARTRVAEGQPARLAVDMARAHFFEPGEHGRNL